MSEALRDFIDERAVVVRDRVPGGIDKLGLKIRFYYVENPGRS